MAEDKIKRLMTRADIIQDIDDTIAPIYFPDTVLDKNRVSTYGYLTETMAAGQEDTIILEQMRAADYCPELSMNEIHVNQTAKLRGVLTQRATPGTCYAIIGLLKNDIINKGTRYSDTERRFIVDRRSTILYGSINFSLEDDILVRAIRKDNRYYYTANYTMEHMTSGIMDSYLQIYEYTSTKGEELLGMIVRLVQCNHNISEQTVVDPIEFTYDGLYFPYDNKLASFEVYYKASPTDREYIRVNLENYLTPKSASDKCLYYNDDETGILKIRNNPWLGLSTNSIIRTEIRETLGADGNITLNGVDKPTFTMYHDAAYSYSGVYVYISILTDVEGGQNGDDIESLKKRLIDAKVRRDNITTEFDILNFINDADANIQLVKKRNDTEDRIYYMYTVVRDENNGIAPATTKPLVLRGPVSEEDPGDFDYYRAEDRRKVLKANARFKLEVNGLKGYYPAEVEATLQDLDRVIKVPADIKEYTVVDPLELPKPETFNQGDIVRIRRTLPNGINSDRTYTISTRTVGRAFADCYLYPDPNTWVGATVINTTDLMDTPSHEGTAVREGLTYGTLIRIDLTSKTNDDWFRTQYLEYEGWLNAEDIQVDEIPFVTAGTKLIIEERDDEDYYKVAACSDDPYVSTLDLPRGYTKKENVPEDLIKDEVYGEKSFYLNCPYLIVVDDMDIANYYFNSVKSSAILSAQTGNIYFPYQMVARNVQIFRDSHAAVDDDLYTFTVVGTMNTENDEMLVDDDGKIIDDTKVMCYLFFTVDGTNTSYLPLKITGYDPDTREFTFSAGIRTSDYITESGVLEITEGLYQIGTDDPWYTCDYKNASFTVYFLFKEGADFNDYATTDQIMTMLPEDRLRYTEKTGAIGTANKDTRIYKEPKIPPELQYYDTYTVDEITETVITSRELRASVENQSTFIIPADLTGSLILSIATADRTLISGTDYIIEGTTILLSGVELAVGDVLTLTVQTQYPVAVAPFSRNWLSLSDGGEPIEPEANQIYTILTEGSYHDKQVYWDDTMNVYALWDGDTGVVADLSNATVVDIDDDQSTDDFYYVIYEDYQGYVPKEDLDYEDVMTPGGYVLMNSYYNNPNNLYSLILEYGKFTRSPVTITNTGAATYQVRAFGPIVQTDEKLSQALDLIRSSRSNLEALQKLERAFNITEDLATYILNNRIKMLELNVVEKIREDYAEYMTVDATTLTDLNMRREPSSSSQKVVTIPNGETVRVNTSTKTEDGWYQTTYGEYSGWCNGAYMDIPKVNNDVETQYLIESVPFLEFLFSQENTAKLYDKFRKDADVYTALLKLTTDFEVSLKYTATYGPSKYIQVSGLRQDANAETIVDLGDLNPTMYFKVYGLKVDTAAIYEFIYEYLREHYITNEVIFISNICTAVENQFPDVESIKYMGVDGSTDLNASFQQFTFVAPDFESQEMITRYVPEQLNATDIRIELVETRI